MAHITSWAESSGTPKYSVSRQDFSEKSVFTDGLKKLSQCPHSQILSQTGPELVIKSR